MRSCWHPNPGCSSHIADAKFHAISADTRFAISYTAIRMVADAGLQGASAAPIAEHPGHIDTPVVGLQARTAKLDYAGNLLVARVA